MRGVVLRIKKSPGDGEIFVRGDGAVLTAPDVNEPDRLLNVLAKLQPLAIRQNIGVEIVIDENARELLSVYPSDMKPAIEQLFKS